MYCPKDFRPCCDDLCYGGGCLAMEGAPMLQKCDGCGAFISEEDSDNCTCDYEEFPLPAPPSQAKGGGE